MSLSNIKPITYVFSNLGVCAYCMRKSLLLAIVAWVAVVAARLHS